jgi:hypothetical protein
MARSRTQKKYAKPTPTIFSPFVEKEISNASEKIKKWTKSELARIQRDKNETTCIPVKNGYKIGLYQLHVYPNKTCDVNDHHGELIHRFDNKISAILYTIYRIKSHLKIANEILSLDQEINKNYTDMCSLRSSLDSALKQKDYFKADVRQARLDIAEKRLELAKDKILKIHKTAKYDKVWE